MAKIKSYTDISQSKKLAEILPLESADMYYPWYIEDDGDTIESGHRISTPNVGNFTTHKVNKMILPCWSLAALLDVLPDNYIDFDDTIKHPSLMKTKDRRYMVIYSAIQYTSLYNNPVDACVALIEKLHNLNLL